MSSKMIGLVKWFNVIRVLASSPHSMEVKISLFTLLLYRERHSKLFLKAKKLNLLSLPVPKVRQLQMLRFAINNPPQ